MAQPTVRSIACPNERDARRIWRLDPAALDPGFLYARVPGGRGCASLCGSVIVAVIVVAGIYGLASSLFSTEGLGGSNLLPIIVGIFVSMPLVMVILFLGWRGARRRRWVDRWTGLEARRVSIERPGDIDQAARMVRVLMWQAVGDPRAPALHEIPLVAPGERAPRAGAQVKISVYVPNVRATRVPCLVTAFVMRSQGARRGEAFVLPPVTVNRVWAKGLLAATVAGVAGNDVIVSGDGAGSDWHCDDASASGCSDSFGSSDGGDGGGGDGGGGGD